MPLWMWLLILAIIGLTITVIWFLFRPTINVAIWMILLLSLGFLILGLYFAIEERRAGMLANAGLVNSATGNIANTGGVISI